MKWLSGLKDKKVNWNHTQGLSPGPLWDSGYLSCHSLWENTLFLNDNSSNHVVP